MGLVLRHILDFQDQFFGLPACMNKPQKKSSKSASSA